MSITNQSKPTVDAVGTATNTVATSPGTMADDTTVGTGIWEAPNNAKISDGIYSDLNYSA